MLTQIYEISSLDEARVVSQIGIDHVGVLVGDGGFTREQPLPRAAEIAAAIVAPARFSALFLTARVAFIIEWARALKPAIIHLGAAPELLAPDQVAMDATKKRAEKLQAKGKEVDFKELLRMGPDGGTTNIRNVKSKHWTRWLGPEHRCVVPFNSFSEFNKAEGGDIWFALDETRPLACFAGIWTNWTSVRKVKEGETTNDLYAFLTTEPNAEVGTMHPKAMPVILTTPEEVETWMTAPAEEALKLQRPLPDGVLRIVARGIKEDPAETGRDQERRDPVTK